MNSSKALAHCRHTDCSAATSYCFYITERSPRRQPPSDPRPQQSRHAPAHLAGRSLPRASPGDLRRPQRTAARVAGTGPRPAGRAATPGTRARPRPAPRSPPNTRQALAPPPRTRGPREVSAPGRPPQRSRGHPRHRPQKGREQSRSRASLRTTTPGMPRTRADYISQKAAGRPPGDAPSELTRPSCLPPGSPREREAARVTSKAGGLPAVRAACIFPGACCARQAR